MAVFAFIKRLAMTGVAKLADWSFQQDPHLKFDYMKQKPPLFSKCDSWQNKGRDFKGVSIRIANRETGNFIFWQYHPNIFFENSLYFHIRRLC